MRVALMHDWLTGMRGGEKCLESLCRLFPKADLYTLLHDPGTTSPLIEDRCIRTSFLQRLPGIARWYRLSLPLMPLAVSRLRLRRRYDLVVSLSHAVAKSVVPPPGVPHVCYCFTPMRYAWHLYHDYFEGLTPNPRQGCGRVVSAWVTDPLRRALFAQLRRWDRRTAQRVTHFVAISRTIQQRIHEAYGRESGLIYPPVDTAFYTPDSRQREGFYLCVSALAPYKRIDLAIQACARSDRELVVLGKRPEANALRRRAGPKVRFLGWQSNEVIRDYLRRCRALLFPGREDFGLVPVEAQACGTPVIAYGEGGACESLLAASDEHVGTAVFFDRQSPESLAAAMRWFESHPLQFSEQSARQQAERFRTERFEDEMMSYLEAVVSGKLARRRQIVQEGRQIKVDPAHVPRLQGPHRPRATVGERDADLVEQWQ